MRVQIYSYFASNFTDNPVCDVPMVSMLLINHGANVNAREENGDTALMLLAEDPDETETATTVPGQANLQMSDDSSMHDFYEVVHLLIAHGADLHARNNIGRTAFLAAAEGGPIKYVKFLFKQGANVNDRDKDGETALKSPWRINRSQCPRSRHHNTGAHPVMRSVRIGGSAPGWR